MAKYVFVDVETTGTRAYYDKIIEIAAIVVEDMKIVKTFTTLVNPQKPIPWFITKLTGIDNNMTKESPTFIEISDEILELMQDSIFVAHNVSFDYSFLQGEFLRVNKNFESSRFCTVKLSRMLFPHYTNHNLDSLIKRMSLQIKSRHRALDDVMVLIEFFKKSYAEFGSEIMQKSIKSILRN